ncbi:Thermophilic serine proteinase [Balamuthia mandrillaris]
MLPSSRSLYYWVVLASIAALITAARCELTFRPPMSPSHVIQGDWIVVLSTDVAEGTLKSAIDQILGQLRENESEVKVRPNQPLTYSSYLGSSVIRTFIIRNLKEESLREVLTPFSNLVLYVKHSEWRSYDVEQEEGEDAVGDPSSSSSSSEEEIDYLNETREEWLERMRLLREEAERKKETHKEDILQQVEHQMQAFQERTLRQTTSPTPMDAKYVELCNTATDLTKYNAFGLPYHVFQWQDDVDGPTGWGFDAVGHSCSRGGKGVAVFVFDSGVESQHSEFSDNSPFPVEECTNYLSLINLVMTAPTHEHGTMVSGIIGGKTFGRAKEADIHSCKVFNERNQYSDADLMSAISYITDTWKQKSKNKKTNVIINMSLAGRVGTTTATSFDPATMTELELMMQSATNDYGILFVAAAGNNAENACSYTPARLPFVLTVGAVCKNPEGVAQANLEIYSRSNYGQCVNVYAPGCSIRAPHIRQDTNGWLWASNTGTSFAAPWVTAIAAVIWGENPTLTPAQVMQTVISKSYEGIIVPDARITTGTNLFASLFRAPRFSGTGSSSAEQVPVISATGGVQERKKGSDECAEQGGCCAYYFADGESSHFVMRSVSPSQFDTIDWTVESWVFPIKDTSGTLLERPGRYRIFLDSQVLQIQLNHFYEGQPTGWCDGSDVCNTGIRLDETRWNHVAVTGTSSKVRVFLNAKQVWTKNLPAGSLASGSSDIFYAYLIGGEGFAGRVDNVRMWNFALTSQLLMKYLPTFDEVRLDLYDVLFDISLDSRFSGELLAEFQFRECRGAVSSDAISRGNNELVFTAANGESPRYVFQETINDIDNQEYNYDPEFKVLPLVWTGDGIASLLDNCPNTYNPPLAGPNFFQLDYDVDGVGDVCDPCPECCVAELHRDDYSGPSTKYVSVAVNTSIHEEFDPLYATLQIAVYPDLLTVGESKRADFVTLENVFQMGTDTDGDLRFRLGPFESDWNDYIYPAVTGEPFVLPERWTNVAVAIDGLASKATVYVGHVPVFTTTLSDTVKEYTLLAFAELLERNNNELKFELGRGLRGLVDEFRVWANPLTEGVVNYYNIPIDENLLNQAVDAGLLHNVQFDECNAGKALVEDFVNGQNGVTVTLHGDLDLVPGSELSDARALELEESLISTLEGLPPTFEDDNSGCETEESVVLNVALNFAGMLKL